MEQSKPDTPADNTAPADGAKTPTAEAGTKPDAPVDAEADAQGNSGLDPETPKQPLDPTEKAARREKRLARKAAAEGTPAKKAKRAKPDLAPPLPPVAPAATAAQPQRRHWGVLLSFFIFVAAPLAAMWWYLNDRAHDQYVSHVGFSVRTEEVSSAMEVLGGLTSLSRAGSSDPDILYEFIQSQEIVQRIDDELDLKAIWSKPTHDPYFAFAEGGTIEDLTAYWARMVKLFYDGTAGLMEVRVLAFDPDDAHAIAQEIFRQSSQKINELSAIARADATRYSREELEQAVERLKKARQALTAFRNRHQIVDPQADIAAQSGLVNTLQTQLAGTLIELDLLRETAREGDPRIAPLERKINVIKSRIEEERKKFSTSGAGDAEAFSTLLGEYEGLIVDREFAEQAYVSALSAFDTAQAEAQRQSRYLAAYVKPTRAERSTYPQRGNIMTLAALFIFLAWAIGVLLAYAIKDRR